MTDIPPDFGLSARAAELLAETQAGVRAPCPRHGLSGRCVVWQAQAMREIPASEGPAMLGGSRHARVLELMPTVISPHHLFAGDAIPACDAAAIGPAWETLKAQPWPISNAAHSALDYAKLLRLGTTGLRAEIATARLQHPEAGDLYDGMEAVLAGLVTYAARHRAAAEAQLAACGEPGRRRELARMVAALVQVPAGPATSFYEAIQSFLLAHIAVRIHENETAVGRLDWFLEPYYQADIASGRIQRREAAMLVQSLLVQLRELSEFSDCIVVGGCHADGQPFWNDLTCFVLDGMTHLRLPSPQIGFRHSPGQPRELLRRAMALAATGGGHPGLFNDPVTVNGLVRAGCTTEHARDYVNCNCVELSSSGRSAVVSGYNYTNLVKPIEVLLNGGTRIVSERHGWAIPDPAPALVRDYADFEDFRSAYADYLAQIIASLVCDSEVMLARSCTPQPGRATLPLSSVLTEGCIERGRHCLDGGAIYQQTFPSFVGFVNAVDSLAAIRHLVFRTRRLTLAALGRLCRDEQPIPGGSPRYGNGDPETDALARWLFELVASELARYRNRHGQAYAAQYFGWITHGRRGEDTAATPDGRRCGAAVSGTLGGDHGGDSQGPTALLRSATSFDHSLACGGTSVNLAIDPKNLSRHGDREKLIDLVLAYFSLGGGQVQISCVSPAVLRQAQLDPAAHRNLVVRVAGYSDSFTALDAVLQEQIISRTSHALT